MSKVLPLVSVITVSFNESKTIRQTIESVLAQTYKNIEYIVVDGGSKDGTMDIVREYGPRISKVISEPDNGISDAFNKGIRESTGEYLQFINSGDVLEKSKIEKSVDAMNRFAEYGFVFGDLHVAGRDGGKIVQGDPQYGRYLRHVMGGINHPTVMLRKSLFERYGYFDGKWKIAMDYDWHLRIHIKGEQGLYLPELIVYISTWGLSDDHRYLAFKECRDISVLHGFNPAIAYLYYLLRCSKHFVLKSIGIR